jgi:hypothetical protein
MWTKHAEEVSYETYFLADILGLGVRVGMNARGGWQVMCSALNLPWTPIMGETDDERKMMALVKVRDTLAERRKADLAIIEELDYAPVTIPVHRLFELSGVKTA